MTGRRGIDRIVAYCDHTDAAWGLWRDKHTFTRARRYEIRIYDGPARGVYRGKTADDAISRATTAVDEHAETAA